MKNGTRAGRGNGFEKLRTIVMGLIVIVILVLVVLVCTHGSQSKSRLGGAANENLGEKAESNRLTSLRQKAEQGGAEAQYNLGVCYHDGTGVPQDYEGAVKWYRLAAEQGLAQAQCRLGGCYHDGTGVPQDDKEAVKWYRLAAEQGLAQAQHNLGLCYYNGYGVPKDYKEAVKWFRLAAEHGFSTAQCNLGVCYYFGSGVPQDYKEAVKWYRLAAAQGDAQAQLSLGVAYADGQGVPQDYKEAMKWYRLAADQGYAQAQCNLGLGYYNGYGVPKDYKEAVKWYRLAAEQGNAGAQCGLGGCYAFGQGVPQDFAQTYAWANIAVDQGDPVAGAIAVKVRSTIMAVMTPAQLEEGQRLSGEYTKRFATSYRAGDGNDIKPSVARPNSRFTDNGDGTMTDNQTGLEWVQAPHSLPGNSGTMNWDSAVVFCTNLVYAGHSDWKLPSKDILVEQAELKSFFTSVQDGYYWSGTSDAGSTDRAWGVSMHNGSVYNSYKSSSYYVWPIRGGQ